MEAETALETVLGALDPDTRQWRASMSGLIGGYGYPYRRLITSRCMSFGELECEIDRLKAELEKIRIKGRRKYASN